MCPLCRGSMGWLEVVVPFLDGVSTVATQGVVGGRSQGISEKGCTPMHYLHAHMRVPNPSRAGNDRHEPQEETQEPTIYLGQTKKKHFAASMTLWVAGQRSLVYCCCESEQRKRIANTTSGVHKLIRSSPPTPLPGSSNTPRWSSVAVYSSEGKLHTALVLEGQKPATPRAALPTFTLRKISTNQGY